LKAFLLDAGSKVVVEGLVLKGFSIDGAVAAELIDCTVQGSSGDAVDAGSGASLTMRGGAVHNSGGMGVMVSGKTTAVKLHGVTVEGSKAMNVCCTMNGAFEMDGGTLKNAGDVGLRVQSGCSATLRGVTVEGSKGYGAYCSGATLEMEGGALRDGGNTGLWMQGDSSTKAVVRDAPTHTTTTTTRSHTLSPVAHR
jgi:hypothetical protein